MSPETFTPLVRRMSYIPDARMSSAPSLPIPIPQTPQSAPYTKMMWSGSFPTNSACMSMLERAYSTEGCLMPRGCDANDGLVRNELLQRRNSNKDVMSSSSSSLPPLPSMMDHLPMVRNHGRSISLNVVPTTQSTPNSTPNSTPRLNRPVHIQRRSGMRRELTADDHSLLFEDGL